MARDGTDKSNDSQDREPRERRPRRRWLRGIVILLLLMGVVAWFAPWIVAKTDLRNRFVAGIVPDHQIHVAAARLDWLSPIQLTDVRLYDSSQQQVISLQRVTTDQTLAGLVWDRSGGVEVTIERPNVDLVVRPDGSNIEDVANGLMDDQQGGGDAFPVRVVITGGTVDIREADTPTASQLAELNATCDYQPNGETPLAIDLTASALRSPPAADRGMITASMRLTRVDEKQPAGTAGRGELQTDALALETVAPLLRRFAPGLLMRGKLQSDVRGTWNLAGPEPTSSIDGSLAVAAFALEAPEWLGSDSLTFGQLDVTANVSTVADRFEISQGRIDTDLGHLELQGVLPAQALKQGDLKALIADEDYRASGRVDLAKLAASLPQLLHLKEDSTIASGELTFALQSQKQDEGRRWKGELSTRNLAGTAAGRPVTWDKPIEVAFDALRKADDAVAGRLSCRSDFIQLAAEGNTQSATMSATGDLDRLAADLRQFVDLGQCEFAGQFTAGLALRKTRDGLYECNGHTLFEQFVWVVPDLRPIREQRMSLAFDATAEAEEWEVSRLDQATLKLISGRDRLTAKLLEPVTKPSQASTWPLDVTMKGALASWLPRVQNWVPLPGWDVTGDMDVSGAASVSASKISARNVDITLSQLRAVGHGMAVNEPEVRLTADGSWDVVSRLFESTALTMASSALALRAEDLAVEVPEASGPRMSGAMAVRGDLGRLQSWFTEHASGNLRWAGQGDGRIRFSSQSGLTQSELDLAVKDFAVYQRAERPASGIQTVTQTVAWEPVWNEENVTISGSAEISQQANTLKVNRFAVNSRLGSVQNLEGGITDLTTRPVVDVRGELHYDLAMLSPLLKPYVGNQVTMSGRGARAFAYRGPLAGSTPAGSETSLKWWDGVSANAGIGWDSINAYGLQAGTGQLEGALAEGVVRFEPLDVSFTQGRLRAQPEIFLTRDPSVLVLGQGRMIERARITPELLESWLQFVAPLLANATRAEGLFSIDLEKAVVPISNAQQSDVAGTLTIHAAQVRPGPMTEQLVSIAQQVDAILRRRPQASGSPAELQLDEQAVPFQITEGRVHHRDLFIEVGDVMVRSRGSVGFDKSLALVAEVPIRDNWIERDPNLRVLRGQTLEIPIEGSLSKPKIDNRILKDLARKVAGGAVNNLLEDAVKGGLDKGLEGLFKQFQR